MESVMSLSDGVRTIVTAAVGKIVLSVRERPS
jgi:hypothetical protein